MCCARVVDSFSAHFLAIVVFVDWAFVFNYPGQLKLRTFLKPNKSLQKSKQSERQSYVLDRQSHLQKWMIKLVYLFYHYAISPNVL